MNIPVRRCKLPFYGSGLWICWYNLSRNHPTVVANMLTRFAEESHELSDEQAMKDKRIRQPGAGRQRALDNIDGLDEAFINVIESYTAGSPMNESIKWTHLTRQQIADLLSKEEGISGRMQVFSGGSQGRKKGMG